MSQPAHPREDSSDLLPGFDRQRLEGCGGVRLHVRVAGDGPPVVLLHGFPQTHVTWHRVAPTLARNFRVVVPDLRGYGDSDAPPGDASHRAYSKRTMAQDVVRLMESLGHPRFAVVGHDRGARVAYRLALDEPGRVERVSVLDVIPTLEMWQRTDKAFALASYHWFFLAQPDGLPEAMLGAAPHAFLERMLRAWAGDPDAFDPRALAEYRRCFSRPESLHAQCEDYRAGATVDAEDDAEDERLGRRIRCPLLALWAQKGTDGNELQVLETWRRWAEDVRGQALPGGHFLPEEAPEEVLRALRSFLGA